MTPALSAALTTTLNSDALPAPAPAALTFGTGPILGAILLLLAISGGFSAAERALTGASRAKLRARADKGDAGAGRALAEIGGNKNLIGAILLGRNAATILAASLATVLGMHWLGGGFAAVAAATLAMTALVLTFAEVLPKTYAVLAPEDLASRVARPAGGFTRAVAPLVAAARLIARGILALFGLRADRSDTLLTVQDEIAGALALAQSSGTVQKADRDRLMGALDLGARSVAEIMRHRSDIQMIDADLPADAVLDQVLKSSYTRLPVYRGERENVIGVIHAKDLLRAVRRALRDTGPEALRDFDVLGIAMPPYFVPETTPLDEQMRAFLARHTHFALVVDEYGSLRGLITLEDILEEIVGDITDEHDPEAARALQPNVQGDYLVDGAMTIRDLNRALDWTLPDDEANTVAGLVIHMSQSIPTPGQVFSFAGYRFDVVARRENRVTRLRIRPLGEAAPAADTPDRPTPDRPASR